MKKIFTLIVMLAATLGMQAQDTWTIAGEKALMGSGWDATDNSNDMTANGSVFTLVKTDVMLKAGSYQYKVLKNHAWDEAYGDPNADNNDKNAVLSVTENAAYKVTFTFDPTIPDTEAKVSAVAEKTGAYEGSDEVVWIVAGAEELMGVFWKGTLDEGAANKMTTTDQKVYTLTKTDVALNKETPYQYKFVKDEKDWYGNLGGAVSMEKDNANFELYVDEPGKYTVVWTLNTETMTQSIETTKTGDAVFGEKTWTICGPKDLCGSEWNPGDTKNDMEKVDEGVFELTRASVELKAKDYSYKVAANHSWGESYGNETGGNKILTVTADGTYDVTFSFIVATKTLDAYYETTGIEAVTVKIKPSAPIYNLQGQRVTSSYRGIAIMDGKKVVMK